MALSHLPLSVSPHRSLWHEDPPSRCMWSCVGKRVLALYLPTPGMGGHLPPQCLLVPNQATVLLVSALAGLAVT